MSSRRPWRLAAAIGLSTFLVLAGTVTASAVWTTSTRSLTATANAATIASTLIPTATLDTEYKYTGALSPNKIGMLTYTNTGSSPVSVALTATNNGGTFGGQLKLSLWTTAAAACETTIPGTATVGTVAVPPALPASFGTVAAGATVKLCLATSVTAALSATQGASITPTFTLLGKAGTNWQTAAANSFTQSVYRIAAPAVPTCVNSGGANITLSWPRIEGATKYTVFRSDGTTEAKSITQPASGPLSITLTPADVGYTLLGPTAPYPVSVVAIDGTYTSTSVATPKTVQLAAVLGLLLPALRCS